MGVTPHPQEVIKPERLLGNEKWKFTENFKSKSD